MLWGKCNFLPHIWKLLERKKYAQRLFRKERESWLNFLSLSLSFADKHFQSHKRLSCFSSSAKLAENSALAKKLWKEYLGLVKRTLQPSHQKKLPFIWKMNGNQDGKFDLFSTKRQEEWRCPKYNIGKRKRVLGGGAGTMKTGKQIRGKSQNLLCM